MKSDFLIALTQLVAERHLPREEVLQAIEAALVSAFKKDSVAVGQNLSVTLNPNTGEMSVFALKTVVEKVEDPRHEISLKEALTLRNDASLGEEVATLEQLPHQASRIAAQTAKQVVLQRLREAEREKTFQEFLDRKDDIVSGAIDQMGPGRVLILDLGRVEAILPPEEQVPTERYRKGQRLKVYLVDVLRTPRGPEIIVSRTHKNLLKRLFEVEVPEVHNGVVEIKAIAREAGFRSKVAVASRQDGVDPVGSCIGMRGNRIQSIVNELQGEKIDIVRWDKDFKTLISNALSPSEVVNVYTNEAEQSATVVVPERQLSLAIGKEGQNARLAAKLTGWRVDIKSVVEWEEIRAQRDTEEGVLKQKAVTEPIVAEVAPVEVAVEAVAPTEVADIAAIEEMVEEALIEEQVPAEVPSQAKAVEKTGPVLTPEEEVLSQVLAEEEPQSDEEEDGEEEPGLVADDSIWQSPIVMADAGKIRFAEDFAEEFRSRGRKGGRRSSRRGVVGKAKSAQPVSAPKDH